MDGPAKWAAVGLSRSTLANYKISSVSTQSIISRSIQNSALDQAKYGDKKMKGKDMMLAVIVIINQQISGQ